MRWFNQICNNENNAWCTWCHSTSNNIDNDLRAGPEHYLGIHETCDPSQCFEVANGQLKNANLHDLPPNLMFEVEWAGDRLMSKAPHLISNRTTNLSKCYMSIWSKMGGGKQINPIQSGLFKHHCMAAGLSLTLGPGWIETTWKHLIGACSSVTDSCQLSKEESWKREYLRYV